MKRKAGAVLVRILLVIMALYTLFPIAFLILNSFKSQAEIVDSPWHCQQCGLWII